MFEVLVGTAHAVVLVFFYGREIVLGLTWSTTLQPLTDADARLHPLFSAGAAPCPFAIEWLTQSQ
jgi:hypothetical protein